LIGSGITLLRKIGVFGGTFDPVHNGHLRCALEVGEALRLDEVRLIPSARPPHRGKPQLDAETRLSLLQLAAGDEAGLKVDARELRRAGPSYTFDTLTAMRSEVGAAAICLIVGADVFAGLPSWHRWEALLDLAHIVVATRPGTKGDWPHELRALLAQCGSAENELSGSHGHIYQVPVTPLDISASRVRALVAEGRNARYLVPDAVWESIKASGLYRNQ
jgi:nicotinate-nucleotide adenylyltransferase